MEKVILPKNVLSAKGIAEKYGVRLGNVYHWCRKGHLIWEYQNIGGSEILMVDEASFIERMKKPYFKIKKT